MMPCAIPWISSFLVIKSFFRFSPFFLSALGVYYSQRNSFLLGLANQDNLDDQGRPNTFYTFLRVRLFFLSFSSFLMF